jgi:glycosyltransferase involved in cell wall biosynthesis
MDKNNMPKISILIITYNQENVIGRALNSILIQKEYIYEIIIGDDCSTDNNWEVITSYAQKYPNLIKPIRNDHNLGIFGNTENLYNKPTGDIVFWLSGDDVFCNGVFAKTIETIKKNVIDYKNELFAIYLDYRIEFADKRPNHNRSNKMIVKKHDPVRLKLRGLISTRSSCYSVKILQKFITVRKDIGICADGLIDIQQMMYAERNYYCKFIGSIYYAGTGVSVKVDYEERYKSYLQYLNELRTNHELCKKDLIRIEYKKNQTLYFLNPSSNYFWKAIKYYFASLDISFGINGLDIVDLLKFVVRSSIISIKRFLKSV